MEAYLWIIPLAPLIAFLVNFLLGRRMTDAATGLFATGSVAVSLLLSVLVFVQLDPEHVLNIELYSWIPSGAFQVGVGAYVDQLTSLMLLVVTSVSLLVHVYSIGYMRGDSGYYRFFRTCRCSRSACSCSCSRTTSCNCTCSGEAVGVCSYLLIGFWYTRASASNAAMKAFIVNRVGDFGFGLGVVLIFVTFGTLAYADVFARAEDVAAGTLTVITLLVHGLIGNRPVAAAHMAAGRDGGPDPVSALIHAATMVTAGVYLVARANPLFEAAAGTLTVVAVVGLVTALLGATIGLVQNDIKRVMAYSTISQLGYMFFALGMGAYVSAIFHLFTHAFFKALLFLGAGSVMHGLNGETDMRRMGGLRRYMPQTFATLLIGSLALAGVPPLAGFWSKDEILGLAFIEHQYWIYGLGTLASFFTAFYITRLMALTFLGSPRFDTETIHPHESPRSMTVLLWTLAGLGVAGFVGAPRRPGSSTASSLRCLSTGRRRPLSTRAVSQRRSCC
ncbi:MAG: NADH-quinone oxidoreductase subunit L [Chloroflexia bacterium]